MLQRLRDRLKGWKTVIVGVAVAMSSSLLLMLDLFAAVDLYALFSPRTAVLATLAIGMLQIVLRFATTTRVGESSEE